MADMELDMVADMKVDKVADKVADMVADMEVNEVADMVAVPSSASTQVSSSNQDCLLASGTNWPQFKCL